MNIPAAIHATEVACFLLANTAFPRSVGLNLAQIEWHLTQLRSRYFLRMSAALERLDHLNGMMTYQNVAELAGGQQLSPFLDYVQREIGGSAPGHRRDVHWLRAVRSGFAVSA